MKRFFKVLAYIVASVIILVLLLVTALNLYYSHLSKSLEQREYPDPATLANVQVEDALLNYQVNLLPYPQNVTLIPGLFKMPDQISFYVAETESDEASSMISLLFDGESAYSHNGWIRFSQNIDLESEGYTLLINASRVVIQYSDLSGMYYGLLTLKQLDRNYSGLIPNMRIEDHPDLAVRGVMLDISRDKVPTLETLFHVVDILADLKYNHLELYVEGFSFAYPSFRHLWEGEETPITGEEIRALDEYCRNRFIDLVPNQNALGHMAAWLETEEFADLAECPDGYNLTPFLKMKTTLDPYDPESIQLIENMTEDMIPFFTSDYFNVNLDEPFELGHCKSRKQAEEIGVGNIYMEFTRKIHQIIQGHGKKMMMWGDVVLKHPDIVQDLPEDVILLDWGYEAEYPFDKNGMKFKETGLEFIVCPGTSSWTSIGGRTDNMLGNIRNAVKSGVQHGAGGMLLTDWGDMGHWQYLPVSYAGFVVGGGCSWNSGSYNESMVKFYLNTSVFEDQNGKMADFVYDLGRYNRFEEILAPNMTLINLGFQFGLMDRVLYHTILSSFPYTFEKLAPEGLAYIIHEKFALRHPFDYPGLLNYLSELEDALEEANMNNPDADLVFDEFNNAMQLIRIGAALKNYIESEPGMSREQKIQYLRTLQQDFTLFLANHETLWLSRNKPGGLDRSMKTLRKVHDEIGKELITLDGNLITRGWARLKDRTIAAAAAVAL